MITLLFLVYPYLSYSQIKVFERTSEFDLNIAGLLSESSTRKILDLNGEWEISFNAGKSFEKYIVPVAYDYKGDAIFRKRLHIDRPMLDNYSFIFVAEGIDYKSEVKINNNIIANHVGGYTSLITPVYQGILSGENEIVINISSGLTYDNTLPLANQINYSKVYGGITKDIYIVAVPKIHTSRYRISYKSEGAYLNIANTIDIQSMRSSLEDAQGSDTSGSGSYSVQTKILNYNTSEEVASSSLTPFELLPNTSGKITNNISFASLQFWTPSSPHLYKIVINIYRGETLVDEFISETGFTNIIKHNDQLLLNGQPFKIKGINYFEDSPRFASALDYFEVENDLRNIKNLGYNLIRVPGRSAHPYIVSISNKIGLFLMQEIPFNDVPENLVSNERYTRLALDNLVDIIIRDRNNPCIFAWGIGNDFNVEVPAALDYVRTTGALADSLGKRFIYYTSRISNTDICSEEVDMVGINIYDADLEGLKEISGMLKTGSQMPNRKSRALFISRYGININNSNTNGYSDITSVEAQAKFLTEGYSLLTGNTFGVIMSSYADWNSERPLNYPLTLNPYIQSDGIYNYYREQKRATEFVKRILHDEELPRINEGSYTEEFPYVFIAAGLALMIIFLYFLNRDRKFRNSLAKSFVKVQYFFYQIKEQLLIPYGYNIFLSILISAGIALFFSSIVYYYRANTSFDMILANFITNDNLKIWFSHNTNNNYITIGLFMLLNIFCTLLTVIFIYAFTFYSKGKFYLKNIYTIVVWASLPLILCLLMGTIILKLAESDPSYIKLSLIFFVILYILYLIRLIKGVKVIYEIRSFKAYIYGSLIIISIFGLIYYYFLLFTSAIDITRLVLYLN